MRIETVWFWRTKKSELEYGVVIGGDRLLLDMQGNPVKRVYRYNRDNRYSILIEVPRDL